MKWWCHIMDKNYFVYVPDKYPGPIALNAKVSKELDEYHKKSSIYFMTEMTQEEFNEITKDKMIKKFKINTVATQENLHIPDSSLDSAAISSAPQGHTGPLC